MENSSRPMTSHPVHVTSHPALMYVGGMDLVGNYRTSHGSGTALLFNLFRKNFEDISPFCGATDTFVLVTSALGFKPGWILQLHVSSPVCYVFLRFNSGADLLVFSMIAKPFDAYTCTCVQTLVGLKPRIVCATQGTTSQAGMTQMVSMLSNLCFD